MTGGSCLLTGYYKGNFGTVKDVAFVALTLSSPTLAPINSTHTVSPAHPVAVLVRYGL
jgi:hypothetical protein